jgi:hypothetical protein
VTATRNSGSYVGSISVVAFSGADVTADGAIGSGNGTTGAPTATLTTSRAGSWVWGVGNDWDSAKSRTVGAGQTKFDEFLAAVGDTYWVQSQTAPGGSANAPVTTAGIYQPLRSSPLDHPIPRRPPRRPTWPPPLRTPTRCR